MALSSCHKRCHCYGYDGSHAYYTKEELSDLNYTCKSMSTQYMYGLVYTYCDYDMSDY